MKYILLLSYNANLILILVVLLKKKLPEESVPVSTGNSKDCCIRGAWLK